MSPATSWNPDITIRRAERFFGTSDRPDYGICAYFERIGDRLWQAEEIARRLADQVPGGQQTVIDRFRFSIRAGGFGPPASRGRFATPQALSVDQRSRAETTRHLVDLDSAVLRPPEPGQYALRPSILVASICAEYMRARQSIWAHWIVAQGWVVPPEFAALLIKGEVVDDRRALPEPVREHKSGRSDIRAAAKKLGKGQADFPTFEAYRRALCHAAEIPPDARGWGEDSIRRALKKPQSAASQIIGH